MQGGAPLVTFVGLKPPVTKFDIYIYKYVYVCTLDLLYLPEARFFLPWCILLRTSLRPRCSTLKLRLNGQSFGEAT